MTNAIREWLESVEADDLMSAALLGVALICAGLLMVGLK